MALSALTAARTRSAGFDPRLGRVAAGGPIAEMQRALAERLGHPDWPENLFAPPSPDDLLHRLSRLAGPALLVTAYATVAARWL